MLDWSRAFHATSLSLVLWSGVSVSWREMLFDLKLPLSVGTGSSRSVCDLGAWVWKYSCRLMWVAQRYGVEGPSVIFQSTHALSTMQQAALFSSFCLGQWSISQVFSEWKSVVFWRSGELSVLPQGHFKPGLRWREKWEGVGRARAGRGTKLIFCGSKLGAGRKDGPVNWHD